MKRLQKSYDFPSQVNDGPAITRQQMELESCSNPRISLCVL